MDLEIIKTQHGLKLLDNYLSNRSYISGCQPSQNDLLVIQKILEDYTSIRQTPLPHVNRWVSHIQSFSTSDANSFPKSNEAIMILPHANYKVFFCINVVKERENTPCSMLDLDIFIYLFISASTSISRLRYTQEYNREN